MFGVGYVGIVRTTLMADTAQFDSAMMGASRTFKRAAHDIRREAQSLFSTSAGLNLAITLPMALAARSIVRTGAEFDATMMKMRQTAKISASEFTKLADSMMAVSRSMRTKPITLAQTGYQAAQAQLITPSSIRSFQSALTKGQKIHPGDASDEDLASGFIANINAFKFASKDFTRIMAEMDKTIVLGRQSWKEYAGTISQVAAIAASIPVGDKFDRFKNMNIALALATQGGVHPSQASTALRNVYLRIYKRSHVGHSELNKVAASYGYTNAAEMFEQGAGGDPTKFLQILGRKINFGEIAQQTAYDNPESMTKAGFLQREITTALQLANASPVEIGRYRAEYDVSLADFEEKYAEAINKPFAIMEGIAAAADRVKIKFFEAVEKPLIGFLKTIERIITAIEDTPKFQKQVLAFAALATTLAVVIRTIFGFFYMVSVGNSINKIVAGRPLGKFDKGVLTRIHGLQQRFIAEGGDGPVAVGGGGKSAHKAIKLDSGALKQAIVTLTQAIRELTATLRGAFGLRSRGARGGSGVGGGPIATPFSPYGLLGTSPKQLGYRPIHALPYMPSYSKFVPNPNASFGGGIHSGQGGIYLGNIRDLGSFQNVPGIGDPGLYQDRRRGHLMLNRMSPTLGRPFVFDSTAGVSQTVSHGGFTMPGYTGPTSSGRAHTGPLPGVNPNDMGRRVYPVAPYMPPPPGVGFARNVTAEGSAGPAPYNKPSRFGRMGAGIGSFMTRPIGKLGGAGGMFAGMAGIGEAVAWTIKWSGVMLALGKVLQAVVEVMEITFLPAFNSLIQMMTGNADAFASMQAVFEFLNEWIGTGLQLAVGTILGTLQNIFGLISGIVMVAVSSIRTVSNTIYNIFADMIAMIRNSWIGRRLGWAQSASEQVAGYKERDARAAHLKGEGLGWAEYMSEQDRGIFGMGEGSAAVANVQEIASKTVTRPASIAAEIAEARKELYLDILKYIKEVTSNVFSNMGDLVGSFLWLINPDDKRLLFASITRMLEGMLTPDGMLAVGGSSGFYEAGTVSGYEALVRSNDSLLKGIQDLRVQSVDVLGKILEELQDQNNPSSISDILQKYNILPEMANLWGRF